MSLSPQKYTGIRFPKNVHFTSELVTSLPHITVTFSYCETNYWTIISYYIYNRPTTSLVMKVGGGRAFKKV